MHERRHSIFKNCIFKESFKNLIIHLHYYVNNNKGLYGKVPQVICCMLCYNNPVNASSLVRIKTSKKNKIILQNR
jgi:hypothetical protein